MRTLLFRYSLKHHLAHRFRLVMVLLSLALGVAIFVSSFESISAAQDSITSSEQAFTGKVEWQVSRGRYLGVDEKLIEKIRQIPGAVAAPLIQSTVLTGPPLSQPLMLVGVDTQSDAMLKLYGSNFGGDVSSFVNPGFLAGGILVPQALLDKHGLTVGSSIQIQGREGYKSVPIAGVLGGQSLAETVGSGVGVMELHAAEAALGSPGIVGRIDVAGASKVALQNACPQCEVDKPGGLSSAAEDALGRIRSLLGVSVIALMVGILLIYNTVQVSILERLRDLAIVRAIGATRAQIFGFLLLEWFVVGLVGSLIGIAIGSFLAYELVEITKHSVNMMVPLIAGAHVHVGPAIIVAGTVIGVGTTLVAAFVPIWVAAHVRPLEVLRPYTYRRTYRYGIAAWIGAGCFTLANVAELVSSLSLLMHLVVIALAFVGAALMFPVFVLLIAQVLRPVLRRLKRPEPFLALDGLLKTPHRTAFTMMTFGAALMMIVATETLVTGYRVSTGQWMTGALPFDFSVMGNDLVSSVYGNQSMPPSLVDKIRRLPGTANVYGLRKLLTPMAGQDVMAVGVDGDEYVAARQAKHMPDWPPGLTDPQLGRIFRDGKGAFVSGNFAAIYGIGKGQSFTLQTPTGPHGFQVLGVVDDYSWPHGCFIMDLASLWRFWKDQDYTYVDASVRPGFRLDEVMSRAEKVASTDRPAFAFNRAQMTEATNSVLEQAVAMANSQAVIAILIGMLGIVNAIWIGVMNRKREIALWRSIGISRRQVRLTILLEGLMIAVVAALVGVFGGLYGGWVPLRQFSFAITGYLYPLVVPWTQSWQVAVLAIVLGLIAGYLPARRAAQLPILESIAYE